MPGKPCRNERVGVDWYQAKPEQERGDTVSTFEENWESELLVTAEAIFGIGLSLRSNRETAGGEMTAQSGEQPANSESAG